METKAAVNALLVEDDALVQKVHGAYLKRMGYQVDIASNGEEALKLYQPNKYQTVILDAGLPDVSGFEIAKKIRAQDNRQYMLLLSTLSPEEAKDKCSEFDIDDFAVKPVEFAVFETMVANTRAIKSN